MTQQFANIIANLCKRCKFLQHFDFISLQHLFYVTSAAVRIDDVIISFPAEMQNIVISVFITMSVCLSANISQKPDIRTSPNFLYVLFATVAGCCLAAFNSYVLAAL